MANKHLKYRYKCPVVSLVLDDDDMSHGMAHFHPSLRSPGTYTAYQQKYRVSSCRISFHRLGPKHPAVQWTWYMAFGTRAIVDIIITATIVVVMYKSRSHFKKCVPCFSAGSLTLLVLQEQTQSFD